MHYILIFIHYMATLRAASRHIHALHRSTDNPSWDSGRGEYIDSLDQYFVNYPFTGLKI